MDNPCSARPQACRVDTRVDDLKKYPMLTARNIRIRGIVQGVGFRPFVFRLAQANTLSGWVFNDEDGVEIHLEGPHQSLDAFVESLKTEAPQAAQIATIHVQSAEPSGLHNFEIRHSERTSTPTTRIAPDLLLVFVA